MKGLRVGVLTLPLPSGEMGTKSLLEFGFSVSVYFSIMIIPFYKKGKSFIKVPGLNSF